MRATILFIAISIFSFSCDKGLTKEQREALKNEMEHREIKKISQEEIYEKALAEGKAVYNKLQLEKDAEKVMTECNCKVKFSTTEDGLGEKSKALYQAYAYNPKGEDNIQKEADNLIFSKPQVENDSLKGVWFITFEKKDIINKL